MRTMTRSTHRAVPLASWRFACRKCAALSPRFRSQARSDFVRPEGRPLSGSQVHSVRLPGYVISAEIIFGMPDQRLTIRHDSGSSARPYADGALLAIRKVSTLVGVHRGLDSVLDL